MFLKISKISLNKKYCFENSPSIWLLGIICNCFIFSCEKQNQRRPNIVFLLADDLGYNELGAYGQKIIKTPNLDKLAKQSMRFTDFVGNSVCAPSRAVLLTSKFNLRLLEETLVILEKTIGPLLVGKRYVYFRRII